MFTGVRDFNFSTLIIVGKKNLVPGLFLRTSWSQNMICFLKANKHKAAEPPLSLQREQLHFACFSHQLFSGRSVQNTSEKKNLTFHVFSKNTNMDLWLSTVCLQSGTCKQQSCLCCNLKQINIKKYSTFIGN